MTNLIVRPIDDDRYSERSQLEYLELIHKYKAFNYRSEILVFWGASLALKFMELAKSIADMITDIFKYVASDLSKSFKASHIISFMTESKKPNEVIGPKERLNYNGELICQSSRFENHPFYKLKMV